MLAIDLMALRAPSLVPSNADARSLAMCRYAREELSPSAFGINTEKAVALLALHYMSKDRMQTSVSGGGVVSAEKSGGVMRSYVHLAVNESNSDLASTAFGKEFLALRRSCIAPFATSRFGGKGF